MTSADAFLKTRYAVVGTGGRVVMFLDPMVSTYAMGCELVGICDINPVRLAYHRDRLSRMFGVLNIPTYSAKDFDQMLCKERPDVVIVCTVDAMHDEYIIRALDAGCDVITEKPLTTDEFKCRRIFEAVQRSGKSVRVTFNMRWMPGATKIKELLKSKVIGNVKSVQLEYSLDTSHGADYFRRWHSEKAKSGGLLVHKSTHHFDLVNWWLDAIPETVFAFGNLAFYGRENAVARGANSLTGYDRYTGSAPDSDPFKLDLHGKESLKSLYLDAEKEDGYIRDRNVFREGIDIEDSLSVLVRYRNGALLNYSLTAFSPTEGFRVTLNGDGGRILFSTHFRSHVIRGDAADASLKESEVSQSITVQPLFESAYSVAIPEVAGSHGGGDPLLQEQIFGPCKSRDSLNRDAGHEQGAASAAIGFAANESIRLGTPLKIADVAHFRPDSVALSELC